MNKRNLDICVTLRCNANCPNCIEFCNMQNVTGLDYDDSDMTLEQIDHFVDQVKAMNRPGWLDNVTVTGGEALLHPKIIEIMSRLEPLQALGLVSKLCINSNLIKRPPDELRHYVVNYTQPKDNWKTHNTALLHWSDFGGKKKTYAECTHYRKDTIVLNYQGYSICCAGDSYLRLFGLEDLIMDNLPDEPHPMMDLVCEQCPFSNDALVPFQRAAGHPVSARFTAEAEKNRAGRKIKKRFPPMVYSETDALPKIAWVCVTYKRPKQLGHLIHSFLMQDYPRHKRELIILDDAGQYDTQSGDGWHLISVPRRFMTLGQKRNAATAMISSDVEVICPVDDDDIHLPHAMLAHATAIENADWTIPSFVYQENQPGIFSREHYHGHSAAWGYRKSAYIQTTGYATTVVGEDAGVQEQLERLRVRIADPIKFGFEPYVLYGRVNGGYSTHLFQYGEYEQMAGVVPKVSLDIVPGYEKVNGVYRLI